MLVLTSFEVLPQLLRVLKYPPAVTTLRNLKRILVRILILLLGELLVLLTFSIELLMNHGPETGVQGMATAANITKSDTKFANSWFL